MRVRRWEYGAFEFKLMSDDTEEALKGVEALYAKEWHAANGNGVETGAYLLLWREHGRCAGENFARRIP